MDDSKRLKLEVAIFNGNRVLVDVIEVPEQDYKTDPARRQMALPQGHDVRGMIAKYMATPDYSRLEPIIDKLDRTIEVELAGWALARWQTVEEALFEIFAFLRPRSPNDLLRREFFDIVNFRGRISWITVIIENGAPSFKTEWEKLKSATDRQSRLRNKLAHFGFCFKDGQYVFYDQRKCIHDITDADFLTTNKLRDMSISFTEPDRKTTPLP